MQTLSRTSAARRLAALALGVLAWSLAAALAAGQALAQHGGGGGGGGGHGGGGGGGGAGIDTATAVAVAVAVVLVLGGIVTAIMIDAHRNAPGSGEPPKPRKRRAARRPIGSSRPSDPKTDLAVRSQTAKARKAQT